MISVVNQANYVIPPMDKPGGRYFPANFTSFVDQNEQGSKAKEKNLNQNKILWGVVALGSAIVLFIIGKKEIPMMKLKLQIRKSYDEIWEDVLKTIDQSVIKIEKPKLKFSLTEKDLLGVYQRKNNSIEVNLNAIKNNEYITYNLEKNLGISAGAPLMPLEEIQTLKKDGVIDDTWIIKKVNKHEKNLAINYALAHEQRHCVQYHYILNDANCGPESLLKNVASKLKKAEPNLSDEKLMEDAKKICPYIVNFKPKGEHRDLTLVSTFSHKGKKATYSTKHLVQNDLEYTLADEAKYDINTLEIDANSFAENYLKTHKKDLQKGCDDFIVKLIMSATKHANTEKISKFEDANISRVRLVNRKDLNIV